MQDRELRMTALEEAKKQSPAEIQAEKDRSAYFAWRDKGDFRAPPPSLVGLNYGPEAARRRETEQTAAPMGALGMGAAYADPIALALAKQNMNDENAEQDANAYQNEIRSEDTYQRSGNSESLMARDFARRMGLLNETSNSSQFSTSARIQAQPQPILPMLLSGLIAGAGQAGAAYLGKPPSDSRLKERVEQLDSVRAVVFEWNEGAKAFGLEPGEKTVGLLADEVEKVLPRFVGPIGAGMKGIDYMGLSAYLLEIIKELNRERKMVTA